MSAGRRFLRGADKHTRISVRSPGFLGAGPRVCACVSLALLLKCINTRSTVEADESVAFIRRGARLVYTIETPDETQGRRLESFFSHEDTRRPIAFLTIVR